VSAVLLLAIRAAQADDAELFNDYLKYSQEIALKHHLIVQAEFNHEERKAKPIVFRYDRYPEKERIQVPTGGSFVRKKDGKWLKSDDWGETGKPAAVSMTKDFDNWIGLIEAPLKNIGQTRDKSQGAVRPTLVENDEDAKPGEIRFVMTREKPTGFAYPHFGFTRFQDKALLHYYGGTMRLGEERLTASIGYDWMFLVDMQVVTPTPTPEASAATAKLSEEADVNELLKTAMRMIDRGSWEVDETMVGNKTIRVHGLLHGKDFDLVREGDGPATRQVTISTIGWINRDGAKTWEKMKPVDRTIYDWVHTPAMSGPTLPSFESVGVEEHEGERWQHVRMKAEGNMPDTALWHYWIAIDSGGKALALRQFEGAGIIRGEVMQTKGTYRPSKEPFVKPPIF
jgi:hypothetical protein